MNSMSLETALGGRALSDSLNLRGIIPADMNLHALRRARLFARFVLAWFVLSVGVAVASPWIHPQSTELVCSAGAMKLLVQTDDGMKEQSTHTLDCSLCANIGSPPPELRLHVEAPHSLSHALRPVVAAHIAWLTAAPLPARGPPSAS
jgi:hypothetical protein